LEGTNPVIGTFIDASGFVMERRMMWGIKTRAEGVPEPAYYMGAEVALWLFAFAAGIVAAALFIFRKNALVPLLTGISAVFVLLC
jgi:hypothetical protein